MIYSVLVGSFVGLLLVVFPFPLWVSTSAGAVTFLLSVGLHQRYRWGNGCVWNAVGVGCGRTAAHLARWEATYGERSVPIQPSPADRAWGGTLRWSLAEPHAVLCFHRRSPARAHRAWSGGGCARAHRSHACHPVDGNDEACGAKPRATAGASHLVEKFTGIQGYDLAHGQFPDFPGFYAGYGSPESTSINRLPYSGHFL